jgi:hypothetical protein
MLSAPPRLPPFQTINLAPGIHTFTAQDVYGDGWNGGGYSICGPDGNCPVGVTSFDSGFEKMEAFTSSACGADETPTESAGAVRDDDDTPSAPAPAPTGVYGAQTVQLTLEIKNWSSDISWQVDGGAYSGSNYENGKTYNIAIGPLEPGTHTLEMADYMGDTWNMFYDGDDTQGSATLTDANGNVIMPNTLMTNGLNTQAYQFVIAAAAPPVVASDDVLPACMNDCVGSPEDGTTAGVCHWATPYMPAFDDSCFSDCDFTDGPSAALVEVCTSLVSIDPFASYGSNENPLNGIGQAAFGAAGSFVALADSYGSFSVADVLTAALPDAITSALPAPAEDPFFSLFTTDDDATGAGSGSGSGSDDDDFFGSGSYAAPTFDDDWFNPQAGALLMASKSTEVSSQTSKGDTAVTAAAVVVGVVALLAVALVVMRRSSSEQTVAATAEADMALTPSTPYLKALPENAADLI